MTKVGKWAIMGLPQPNKSDEGRYAAGEKAAPAFLCQSSVRSRQRPQRQAQRRKGEEGVFGQARGMPPAPFHRGMDRERVALDACRVRGGTTRTLRRGLRFSDASSLCGREKGHACLFEPIFCSFTPNVRVGGARAILWQAKAQLWPD
jgi:hypothetical protein